MVPGLHARRRQARSEERVTIYREEQRLLRLLPLRMEVQVTDAALRLDLSGVFSPFSRRVDAGRIRGVDVRDGIIMRPFGYWGLMAGVGIRIAPGFGRVYNFGYSRGISVRLDNDRRLVIGSGDPERLAAAVELAHRGPRG